MTTIVSALGAEAAPLIDYLGLEKIERQPFPLYRKEERFLIISGIGMLPSAIATTHILTRFPQLQSGKVVNIGIAGASRKPIGSLFQIKKVIDHATDKVYHLPASFSLPGASLSTFATPCSQTREIKSDLADMEAAGFLKAAKTFVPDTQIHLLKIVSDNLEPEILSKERIAGLITPHLPTLKELL
ncbi:MAG: hypothetical protein B6D59_05660 [Campylobacteraceae bacterium 4484_4]|nr:MAG: hypothetical protein B6D59_05660 [Campylobacteraceae bacterium 4484_4]